MNLSKVEQFYAFKPGDHDFYRCFKCHRIFTQEYERERLDTMKRNEDTVMHIHCTSLRYQPCRPHLLEWLYPSVISYTFKVILARVVAPWAKGRGYLRIHGWALGLASNKVTRGE